MPKLIVVVLAAVVAFVIHGRVTDRSAVAQPGAAIAAAGYGLIAGGLVTLHLTALMSWSNVDDVARGCTDLAKVSAT